VLGGWVLTVAGWRTIFWVLALFGLACGADAYIRKPFKAQELLEHIRALTGKTAPTPPPPAVTADRLTDCP